MNVDLRGGGGGVKSYNISRFHFRMSGIPIAVLAIETWINYINRILIYNSTEKNISSFLTDSNKHIIWNIITMIIHSYGNVISY